MGISSRKNAGVQKSIAMFKNGKVPSKRKDLCCLLRMLLSLYQRLAILLSDRYLTLISVSLNEFAFTSPFVFK
jgi:hypothetical protein